VRRILYLVTLGILSLTVLAPQVAAEPLRWQTNASYRVSTMGGATLAIEDDTTMINAFNHQNVAGSALLEKENRLDLGASYSNTHYELTEDLGGGITQETKKDDTVIQLTRPGGEYRGVMYWLTDSLVMRAYPEFTMLTIKGGQTTTGFPVQDEEFNLYGGGGGASLAYVLESGLAFGAGLSYMLGSGKPKDLNGLFGVYTQTDKYEFTLTNLDWQAGLAWAIRQGVGENNQLTFGFHVGANDERPDLSDVFFGSLRVGDYTSVIEYAGSNFAGTAVSRELTTTVTPLLVGGEAIFKLADMLQAGLLFDYLTRRYDAKTKDTVGTAITTTEYKSGESSKLGVTPIIKANIEAGQGIQILPGAYFTTMGSTLDTSYRANGTKSGETETGASTFGVGVGLQAMEKQFQAGVQFETGSWSSDYTPYSGTGVAGTISTSEGGSTNIRVGAEFWAIPSLALRAGFASLSEVTKDAAVTSSGGITDLINNTSRITFGAGLALGDLTADLLVQMDTYTEDPKPVPEPKSSSLGVYAGVKIPL
jgi:hypothetical protein